MIDSDLITLFHAPIEKDEDRYVVEIPRSEVEAGAITPEEIHQIGIIQSNRPEKDHESNTDEQPEVPVEEGDQITVRIEDVGKQGDGVARVDPGYVIFVPETEPGDVVEIEVGNVTSTFAFGEKIDS